MSNHNRYLCERSTLQFEQERRRFYRTRKSFRSAIQSAIGQANGLFTQRRRAGTGESHRGGKRRRGAGSARSQRRSADACRRPLRACCLYCNRWQRRADRHAQGPAGTELAHCDQLRDGHGYQSGRTSQHPWPESDGNTPGTKGRKTGIAQSLAIAETMISATAAPSPISAKTTVPPDVLATRELVKIYGGRAVVNGINVNVKAGEIVGLLGPNGAGKTTTFYMIVGLVRPNSGSVIFRDQDVTTFPMYKRARLGMGYLPQEESIFRKMTVEQNILAILETLALSKHERRQRCDHLLHQFGIEKIAKNTALTLSGGEKRRLTIARSLVTSPSLLMLDEPFSGVDPIAVYDVQQIVVHLRKSGLAIPITDHNVRETLSIVDRAYLIYEGRVESEGSKDFLINDPISRQLYLGERFRM